VLKNAHKSLAEIPHTADHEFVGFLLLVITNNYNLKIIIIYGRMLTASSDLLLS
jgi:hypothetical protein